MTITQIEEQIFKVKEDSFEVLALEVFHYQYQHTDIYRQYVQALGISPASITSIAAIPFLPIQFFKTHVVKSSSSSDPTTLFESSGTSGQFNSKHHVTDINLYEQSFLSGFRQFFGEVSQYAILGLLPSYLERGHSSLVYMVDRLIQESGHTESGFYLHNHEELNVTLRKLEAKGQATILLGVTYALLDFAEHFPMPLQKVHIIETGGMKGRREELLREEVHTILKKAFSMESVSSEYGMTELLSQAYALKEGVFKTPSWMKVMVRDMNDPFQISVTGKGALNIIDLANIHACSFIATDDAGEVFDHGDFMVNGRLDNSDIRGCSLMTL
jgi:hypothetical protein